jgi:hypothetical protein
MSGQPVQTASDQNKFRNEYIESLNLQESINDMNLQANKTYLLTGQLPPQSQLQDTRTTAEKLKDVELMKQNVAKELAPIAEPAFAYAIVDKVIESPLNLNNSLFKFLAQRASSIAEQLKKSYTYGIAGDENDLLRIVEFIKNMYSEQQGKFQSTKSYLNSTSSQSVNSRVLNGNDIDAIILGLQDIIKNIDILIQKGVNVGGIPQTGGIARRIGIILANLKNSLPTTDQIRLMMDDLENPQFIDPYQVAGQPPNVFNIPLQPGVIGPANVGPIGNYNRADLEAFYNLIEKLPKYSEVNALISKIKQYISSGRFNLVSQGLINLENMFASVEGINNNAILQQFRDIKNRQSVKQQQYRKLESEQTRAFITQQSEDEKNLSRANKVYIVNPNDRPVYTAPAGGPGAVAGAAAPGVPIVPGAAPAAPVAPAIPVPGPVGRMPYLARTITALTMPDIQAIAGLIIGNPLFDTPGIIARHVGANGTNQYSDALDRLRDVLAGRNLPIGILKPSIMSILSPINAYNPSTIPPTNPLGIAGLGLKRRVGRPRGSGMPKPEVQKIPNFIGFGINEINQKKLKDGIVKIRRGTRTNYPDMPSKRVSNNLQNILNTIVGGGIPKYEELGKLDDEEKDYLHKIVSRSNLTDRLSVPAPSKDQQEKDIHNFEVMKGQILSGNDSLEMVKKFKLIVRKLSKQGLLPKADVDDMLDTLLELGY